MRLLHIIGHQTDLKFRRALIAEFVDRLTVIRRTNTRHVFFHAPIGEHGRERQTSAQNPRGAFVLAGCLRSRRLAAGQRSDT